MRWLSTQGEELLDQAASVATAQPEIPGGAASAPLQACMQGLEAIHSTLGLPWWATISLLAVGVRVSMLPIAVTGIKAGATTALLPAARAAAQRDFGRQESGKSAGTSEVAGGRQRRTPGGGADEDALEASITSDSASSASSDSTNMQAKKPPLALVLQHLERLRRQRGLPHPAWVVGAPLLQFPFFVGGMTIARGLAVHRWPGVEQGGFAWFGDLTLPALDYGAWVAPMGVLGLLLPAAIVLNTSASLDAALRLPILGEDELRRLPQQTLVWRHVVRYLRFVLDVGMVPLLLVALQVPQAALVYWFTSSGFTLAQSRLLRGSPAVRAALGLDLRDARPNATAYEAPPLDAVAEAERGRQLAARLPNRLKKALARASAADEERLLRQAAEFVAAKQHGPALAVLLRLTELVPEQPTAAYALGQTHAALKQWPESERWFAKAAEGHEVGGKVWG